MSALPPTPTATPAREGRGWGRTWDDLKSVHSSSSGRGRLVRAAAWSVLGGAAARALSFLAVFVVARALTQPVFGQWGMIQNTLLMVGVFSRLGLGMTATRFVSLHRTSDPARAGRVALMTTLGSVLLGVVGVFAVWALAPWLAEKALNDASLAPLLRLSAPLLILGAVQDTSVGVLAGLESFRQVARVVAISGIAQALAMVAGVYAGGLPGLLIGMMTGTAAGCGVTHLTLRGELERRGMPGSLRGWRAELPILARFAVPTMLANAFVISATWMATAYLYHQPEGDQAMGLYNAAHQIRLMILYVPGLVATAGLPILTQLWGNTSGREYLRLLRLNLILGFLLASGVAIPAMVAAPWIMAGFGPAFSAGTPVLRVLAATAVITATLNMVGQSMVSEGRMWSGLLLNVVWAAVLLGTSALWIPANGPLGLAWANLVAFGVHLVTVSLYVWRRSRETPGAGWPAKQCGRALNSR